MESERLLLFLDDEENILKALSRSFIDDDYEIETFTEGTKALEFVRKNPVQLIISDQRMPTMSGTEFFEKVRDIRPEAIRILLTGYADMDATIDAINKGQIFKFMVKPWNDEELRTTVMRALEYYDLQQENKRLLTELSEKNLELEKWNQELGVRVKERTKLFVEKNLELNKLNKTLEGSIINVVKVFNGLIAEWSQQVSSHSRRVASMAVTIAENMGFSQDQINDIEIAALLHDLGKIGISRSVIEKPKSHLTDKESDQMREHPAIGRKILTPVERFSKVSEIIFCHHENWDGSGYPRGISEDKIPIESRLISVCNSFDRHYNVEKVYSRNSMKNYFRRSEGVLFDPDLCEQILQFIDQEGAPQPDQKFAQVMPTELRPGMTLASDLQTGGGIFLLPHGQSLKESHIESILEMHKLDPIEGMIRVFLPKS